MKKDITSRGSQDHLCGAGSQANHAGQLTQASPVRAQLRVLVNMECSGAVRRALRARGHDAWSCDLKPAEDGGEHIQGNGLEVAYWGCWDAMIAHPVCTYMANSGAKHLYRGMNKAGGICPDRWAKMVAATEDFLTLWRAPIPVVALENPIMHGHAKALIGMRQSQVIQPWMFGHTESKATCLWLRGLPLLRPTNNVHAEMMARPYAERAKVHCAPPGPNRQADRSRTYSGIAEAIASQWFGEPAILAEAA